MSNEVQTFKGVVLIFIAALVAGVSGVLAWHAIPMLLAFDREAMGLFFGGILITPAVFGFSLAKKLFLKARALILES